MYFWINLFAAAFIAAVMFSGSAATEETDIRTTVGEWRLLARALLVNVVAVPLMAAALLYVSGYRGGFAVGAVLAAICPGAPFGTYFAGRSRGDVGLAMILTFGLTLVALVTTPITSRLIFGPGRMVPLPRGLGLLLTALIVFLPALLGQAVRRKSVAVARRLRDFAGALALAALAGANIAAVSLRSKGIRGVGLEGSALILLLVVASMALGWLAGGSTRSRVTLVTSTGLRNIGLAFLFAVYSFHDPEVRLGVGAYSILMLIPNLLFAGVMRWRARENANPAR